MLGTDNHIVQRKKQLDTQRVYKLRVSFKKVNPNFLRTSLHFRRG